ncbi:MAG TPA: hypothetical protein PLJ47_06370 [Candidatus Hydrogenedentes bacterium]|nr:hypothetical protein [Candidatus Hydrogenedentota bacterium]HRK34202.1 hypothetical protein [Candidatus Hydrogenedentota bacterium]
MRSLRQLISGASIAAVGCLIAVPAFAQEEPGASPEPGDNPAVETVEVSPSSAETSVEAAPTTDSATTTPGVLPSPLDSSASPSTNSIEQRVDNTRTNEAIRVAPKSRKNVYRIDNLPNKPRVKPIAVIKGPVSPWGYATRYAQGEVSRPSAKELSGTDSAQPGARGRQGQQQGGPVRIGGGRRAALEGEEN